MMPVAASFSDIRERSPSGIAMTRRPVFSPPSLAGFQNVDHGCCRSARVIWVIELALTEK